MLFSNMAASIATDINIHLRKHLSTLLCVTASPWTSPFVVQAHGDRARAWCAWLPWISRSVCAILRYVGGQHDISENALLMEPCHKKIYIFLLHMKSIIDIYDDTGERCFFSTCLPYGTGREWGSTCTWCEAYEVLGGNAPDPSALTLIPGNQHHSSDTTIMKQRGQECSF